MLQVYHEDERIVINFNLASLLLIIFFQVKTFLYHYLRILNRRM
jgi:hypothetical protein